MHEFNLKDGRHMAVRSGYYHPADRARSWPLYDVIIDGRVADKGRSAIDDASALTGSMAWNDKILERCVRKRYEKAPAADAPVSL